MIKLFLPYLPQNVPASFLSTFGGWGGGVGGTTLDHKES